MKYLFSIFITAIILLALPVGVLADGIIIPQPPICDPCPPPPCPLPHPCPPVSPMQQLVIRSHQVNVQIKDQMAVTRIDQVFYNPNSWEVEGLYLFPLPIHAAISSFNLWIDGKPVEGKILEAEQARQQYWEIVNNLRDPALLEYVDQGAFRAHIFPMPPQSERRIELEYVETLSNDKNLVRYVYPLNTEKFSLWPLEQVSIQVDIHSSQAMQAVYSPSHPVEITRLSPNQVKVNYAASQITPNQDFALYYSIGSEQSLHLLSYRDPNDAQDPDGFFLLLLTPQSGFQPKKLPKDLILVLDRSGSMEGEKFRQTVSAARYILEHLNPEDRFNLVAFSSGIEVYSEELQGQQATSQAIHWLETLSAQGSTDINRALLEAAAMTSTERPTYLIFLTDGLPTEGVIDSQEILENLSAVAPKNLRLFSFGVGYDVDTFLLDSLVQEHRGATTYVLPDEALDEVLSTFYAQITTPLLTDLSIDFGDISVYDVFPNPIPDLFEGSQIVLSGRFRQGGSTTLTLSGKIENQVVDFQYNDQFFNNTKPDDPVLAALPQIWATRKIGHLLKQVRLKGPDQETIAQIIKLSIRYGVITPYTAYLVTDHTPLGEAAQELLAQEEFTQMQNAPQAPVFGQTAVEKSAFQASMAEAEMQLTLEPEVQQVLRFAGSHRFIFKEGKWIDTRFDPETMQVHQVQFLSPEYRQLVNAYPELGKAFSLGRAVIAVHDGRAFEIIPPAGTVAQPFEALPFAPEVRTTPSQLPEIAEIPKRTPTTEPNEAAPATPGGCSSAFILTGLATLSLLLRRRL